jgi:hypothetical protein
MNRLLSLLTAPLALTLAALAQEPPPPAGNQPPAAADAAGSGGGWRKFEDPKPGAERAPAPPGPAAVPADQFVLPAGTWITVRVNETISSDASREGDLFTATLAQPIVVDGFVVARRGQTVVGRVTEVQKAGRIKGTSRLGIELTEITIVDGQQAPVRTQLAQFSGSTSHGSDATAIGTSTGIGAAIGAAADGGFGAGMGAIAGAGASTIGVLLTRGRQTVVYPEATLTFRTSDPLTISTDRSKAAFHPVRQEDYEPRQLQQRASQRHDSRGPGFYPYPYWGWGWPYYGPAFYGAGFSYFSPVYVRGGRGRGGRR